MMQATYVPFDSNKRISRASHFLKIESLSTSLRILGAFASRSVAALAFSFGDFFPLAVLAIARDAVNSNKACYATFFFIRGEL